METTYLVYSRPHTLGTVHEPIYAHQDFAQKLDATMKSIEQRLVEEMQKAIEVANESLNLVENTTFAHPKPICLQPFERRVRILRVIPHILPPTVSADRVMQLHCKTIFTLPMPRDFLIMMCERAVRQNAPINACLPLAKAIEVKKNVDQKIASGEATKV